MVDKRETYKLQTVLILSLRAGGIRWSKKSEKPEQ
jgi:hypothetical protein